MSNCQRVCDDCGEVICDEGEREFDSVSVSVRTIDCNGNPKIVIFLNVNNVRVNESGGLVVRYAPSNRAEVDEVFAAGQWAMVAVHSSWWRLLRQITAD